VLDDLARGEEEELICSGGNSADHARKEREWNAAAPARARPARQAGGEEFGDLADLRCDRIARDPGARPSIESKRLQERPGVRLAHAKPGDSAHRGKVRDEEHHGVGIDARERGGLVLERKDGPEAEPGGQAAPDGA